MSRATTTSVSSAALTDEVAFTGSVCFGFVVWAPLSRSAAEHKRSDIPTTIEAYKRFLFFIRPVLSLFIFTKQFFKIIYGSKHSPAALEEFKIAF